MQFVPSGRRLRASAIRAAWISYSSAYRPPRATRSSWMPSSTTRAPSSTTIRSAMRTVENRCETRTVMRPSSPRRARLRRRSARTARARSRRRARPSARRARRRSGRSRMKPRASASFCHCPIDSSTPSCQVGPSCVSSPCGRRSTTSLAPARPTAAPTAGAVVEPRRGRRRRPSRCATYSKRKKSWNAPDRRVAPVGGRMRARSTPSTVMRPLGRLVEAAEQLHERRLARAVLAHERDDRAGRQRRGRRRRAPARSVPGYAERHVLEADALARARRARGRRRCVAVAAA